MRWISRWFIPFVLPLSATTLLAGPPSPEDPFEREEVRQFFSDLLREGGMGRLPRERAAFLTTDDEGNYQCLMWPGSNRFNSDTFSGRIPPGVMAIVHTHPRETPLPSSKDRSESIRLGLPIVVLTPRNVEVAMPDGSSRSLVRNQNWVRSKPESRCERMVQ